MPTNTQLLAANAFRDYIKHADSDTLASFVELLTVGQLSRITGEPVIAKEPTKAPKRERKAKPMAAHAKPVKTEAKPDAAKRPRKPRSSKTVSDDDKASVIAYVREHARSNAMQISRGLGWDPDRTKGALSVLRGGTALRTEGVNRGMVYFEQANGSAHV